MTSDERQKMYFPMMGVAGFLLLLNVGYYSYDVVTALKWNHYVVDYLIFEMGGRMDWYRSQYILKGLVLICLVLMQAIKAGKAIYTPWKPLIRYAVIALAIFLFPILSRTSFLAQMFYAFTSIVGAVLTGNAVALLGRKIKGLDDNLNDNLETFDQCRVLIKTDDSFNFKMRFYYKHKWNNGYINVVNPFRALMLQGTPGSGKSYSVINPIIEQALKKDYTMFCYDYKYPTLTNVVYNNYLENKDRFREKYGKDIQFCVVNFDDVSESMRFNPLSPRYIRDAIDTSEIAKLLMDNINPQMAGSNDFWATSGRGLLDAMLLLLRIYENGRYCTLPHLIELIGEDYEKIFEILDDYPETKVKIRTFRNSKKAPEMLMGMLANAQVPFIGFVSPTLYWVLSGNDFELDINNPDAPKIVCIGNDPDRQSVYGTALSLLTSRLFREINHPGRMKSVILFDELPTVYLDGIDKVIATARSNKVSIVLGVQDKSQLMRDYNDKNAEVILDTVGNKFSGQVNGRSAKEAAETFGREFREQHSETTGGENDTVNRSFQLQEILTQSRIETLRQGMFFGVVSDDFDVRTKQTKDEQKEMEKRLFCAEILIDNKAFAERKKRWKEVTAPDGFGIKLHCAEIVDEDCICQLTKEITDEELEKKAADPMHSPVVNKDKLRKMAVSKWTDTFDDVQRTRYRNAIIKKARQKEIDEIVMANYYKIKQDIADLVEKEYERVMNKRKDQTDKGNEGDKGHVA